MKYLIGCDSLRNQLWGRCTVLSSLSLALAENLPENLLTYVPLYSVKVGPLPSPLCTLPGTDLEIQHRKFWFLILSFISRLFSFKLERMFI